MSTSSLIPYLDLAEKLESIWSKNMPEGIKLFNRICEDVEDDEQRQEAAKVVASKIRNASVFKRSQIYEELTKTSMMCRIYLSHEFRSVQDCNFPRWDIFFGNSRLECTPLILQPRNSYTKVFGKNEKSILGVSNCGETVHEAMTVNFPQCRKIEMSNSHTLLLAFNGRLYGCGKASLFRIDGKVFKNVYYEKRTLIEIPHGEIVEDMLAVEDGSIIVTNKYMYAIGNIKLNTIKRDGEITPITAFSAKSESCLLKKPRGTVPRLVREGDIDIALKFYNSPEGSFQEHPYQKTEFSRAAQTPNFTERGCRQLFSLTAVTPVTLKVCEKDCHAFVFQLGGSLMNRFSLCATPNRPCLLVLNGRLVKNWNVVQHYTSTDGKIMMKLGTGVLVKGRLEILRQKNAERWQHFGNMSFSNGLREFRMVAIVEEIPGSYGVDTFCCSPDLESCIFQIGYTKPKMMHSYRDNLIYTKQIELLKKFEEACVANVNPIETIVDTTRDTLKRIIFLAKRNHSSEIWNRNVFACALSVMNKIMKVFQKNSWPFQVSDEKMHDIFVEIINPKFTGSTEENVDFALENIRGEVEQIHNQMDNGTMITRQIYRPLLKYLGNLALVAERSLTEEIAASAILEETDGKFDFRRYHGIKLKTQNIEQLVNDLVGSGDLKPEDIPIDLKIIVASGPEKLRYLTGQSNKVIFGLMYPNWAEQIEDDCFTFPGIWAHNYFYNRADSVAAEKSTCWKSLFPDVSMQIVRKTYEGEVMCQLIPKNPITDFVGPTASEKDIWYLEALDGQCIAVHRFLIMLYSRQTHARQRFDLSQGKSLSDTENLEPVVIETYVTAEVIKNAMGALLDMSILYGKKIDDIIALLEFYDYHLMEEAFSDALDIILKMINDTNMDVFYRLFDKYEAHLKPYLLKHSRIILMSASEHTPPRGFIKRFCKLLSNSVTSNSAENREHSWPKAANEILLDDRDVLGHLIDFSADQDEEMLQALATEWNLDYESIVEQKNLEAATTAGDGNAAS